MPKPRFYAGRRKENPMLKREEKQRGHRNEENDVTTNHMEAFELPIFDLLAIANATNNFSIKNKLGEGGFGPVYKIQTNAASLIESTGHILSGYRNYCPSHEHDRTPRCCSCEKSGAKGR